MAITKKQRKEVEKLLKGFFSRERWRKEDQKNHCSFMEDFESEEEHNGFTSSYPGLNAIREKVKQSKTHK